MSKTMKFLSCALGLALTFTLGACSNDELSENQENNTVQVKPLATMTRAFGENEYVEGYELSSSTSELVADTYLNANYDDAYCVLLNKQGEEAYYLHFKIEGQDVHKGLKFTTYNEDEDPIMSGVYNEKEGYMSIDHVYGNDAMTRASAAFWGCHIAVWSCGVIWSAAAGTVSAGAGAVAGLVYTAAAVGMCSNL